MYLSVSFCTRSRALLVILRDVARLAQLLQLLVGLATHVPDGNLALLRLPMDDPCQVTPALLRELRNREPDHVAVARGVQPQVRLHDGALDCRNRALIPRRDHQQPRFGDRYGRHLVQRQLRSVHIHGDPIQQRGARAPGTDAVELTAGGLHSLLHLLLGLFED